MSTATLDELGLTPPAAADDGQAVSVAWRPEAVDLTGWPSSGPWSRVRRGVPVLRVPELDQRSYHRLLCIALSRGLINTGEHHLGQWLQDDIGPGGAIGWRHEDMTDYAQHYADWTAEGSAKPKKCCVTTFWRRLRVLREDVGLVAHLEAAYRGQPARYEVCVRADSPLLVDLPQNLARRLRLDVLAQLLAEHEVPVSTEPLPGAPLTQIAEIYGGAQLPAEQQSDAAAVSLMGQYEIALIHAKTREEEEAVARLALAASHGWADADARPAGDVPPPAQRPALALRVLQEPALPGRPMPAALKTDLARLAGIKRAVMRGLALAGLGPASKCKTSPITEMALVPYGSSPLVSSRAGSAQADGRSRTKAAPTARINNSGAGHSPAGGGWPGVENLPEQGTSAPVRPKLNPVDLAEGERVARRVWAIWRDRRPTQTLLGQWVTDPDGLSVWQAGTGWDDLVGLIARCLLCVPESAIIDHAAAAVSDTVRDPVKALCKRLWKIRRLDRYEYRPDRSRPAEHVLAEAELSPDEQAARYRGRHASRAMATPGRVLPDDSSAAELLRAQHERLRQQMADRKAAAEAEQAERERRDREYWDAFFAQHNPPPPPAVPAAQPAAPSGPPRARTRAEQDLLEQRAREMRDRELGRVDLAARLAGPLGTQGEPAPARAQSEAAAPSPGSAQPEAASWVADRLARWSSEGRLSDQPGTDGA